MMLYDVIRCHTMSYDVIRYHTMSYDVITMTHISFINNIYPYHGAAEPWESTTPTRLRNLTNRQNFKNSPAMDSSRPQLSIAGLKSRICFRKIGQNRLKSPQTSLEPFFACIKKMFPIYIYR